MKYTASILMFLICSLFVLTACDDSPYPAVRLYSSINADGSQFTESDNRLNVSDCGNAFYISDDLIFHLGKHLVRRNLISNELMQLTTTGMTISDNRYLAIDRTNQLLYFAANDAIYKVGFDGQGLSKLSPDGNGKYSAPVLSSCGQYLSAIRDKHVSQMEISTGEWIDYIFTNSALYAYYASDVNAYYVYTASKIESSYYYTYAFYRVDVATNTSSILMSDVDFTETSSPENYEAQISGNGRYFAFQIAKNPYLDIGLFFTYWTRYYDNVHIYDRIANKIINIPDSFCYAFLANGDNLVFSRLKYGMADLMLMELASENSTMIWDGYYGKETYSFSISKIYPRYDGQKIYIDGWKRQRRPLKDNKSITAP